MSMLLLVISAVLVNNVVLARFLGVCPFLGVSKKLSTALGMSGAVLFVMTLASMISWILHHQVLAPLGLGYLQTLAFILIIASMVQLVELATMRLSPPLYRSLGIFLPLITTNCAVLGVAVLNVQKNHTLPETILFGVSSAAGFGLALVLFSGIREILELSDGPRLFRGTPLALITAGILSLAFMGFAGLVPGEP